jgi:hypothetical protein
MRREGADYRAREVSQSYRANRRQSPMVGDNRSNEKEIAALPDLIIEKGIRVDAIVIDEAPDNRLYWIVKWSWRMCVFLSTNFGWALNF